jgi:hypothetical protein
MTDTPEKIWAGNDGFANRWDYEEPVTGWEEYTRTDVADARIKELKAALLECREEIEGLHQDAAGASL